MAWDNYGINYLKLLGDTRNRRSQSATDIMGAGLNLGDRFAKAKQEAARLRSAETLAREGEIGATNRAGMAQIGESARLDTSIAAQKAMQTEKLGAEGEQARLDRENRADMLTAELEARGKLQTQADEAAWDRTLMEIDAAFRRSANEGEAAMKRVEAQIAGDKEVAQIRVNADASKEKPSGMFKAFLDEVSMMGFGIAGDAEKGQYTKAEMLADPNKLEQARAYLEEWLWENVENTANRDRVKRQWEIWIKTPDKEPEPVIHGPVVPSPKVDPSQAAKSLLDSGRALADTEWPGGPGPAVDPYASAASAASSRTPEETAAALKAAASSVPVAPTQGPNLDSDTPTYNKPPGSNLVWKRGRGWVSP